MICPHCGQGFFNAARTASVGAEKGLSLRAHFQNCPACAGNIVVLEWLRIGGHGETHVSSYLAYPRNASRPLSSEVPDPYATDYREAAAVLRVSPKASAALSRRILQHLIREEAGITERRLVDEIDKFVGAGGVMPALADDLHAVRHVGNFAAHPTKDTSTGEVVEVEEGEAEWLLDLLDGLFHHFFVGPAEARARREALNEKLRAAGKPEMPEPSDAGTS